MAFSESQSPLNQRLRTWPFRRHHTPFNENTNGKTNRRPSYDSELDLTGYEPLKSIFMTDSSKTMEISEQDISMDTPPISIIAG